MYEPLSLRGRSFFISWDLTGGGGQGGKRVGAMKKKMALKGGNNIRFKGGSLKNPFKFCNDCICNNANRNKSNFSLGKSDTLSHFFYFLFFLALSFFLLLSFAFLFFFFGGGGGVIWTQGDLSYTTGAPLSPSPTTTIKK